MTDINKLEEHIAKLPIGYITEKVINEKKYYCQQWKENGKSKSRYISEEEANTLKPQIEERKKLQKELKALKKTLPDPVSEETEEETPEPEFKMSALYGEALLNMAQTASQYERRDCFSKIQGFLKTPAADKVCLVFGLRRTGKTTLLKQLVLAMNEEEQKSAIYIKASTENTIEELNADLKIANKLKYKYVLIDEITLIEKFIDNAALLSDVYAVQGLKIVLSGADSLGFWFAQNEELYDRAVTVHTTFVPFREYSRLLKIHDIDEYIRYGGTLKAGETNFEDTDANAFDASFRTDESTRRYIDTAIAQNIQHSLKCYDRGNHFRNLIDLYKKDELTNAINRIIEDMNQAFTVDVITRDFNSSDLGSAKDLLRREKAETKRTDFLDTFDASEVTKKLMDILKNRNKERQSIEIKEVHIQEITEYLKALDLLQIVYTENIPISNKKEERIIFTQSGMRFCQAQVLVYSLMQDEVFGSLTGDLRDIITEKILEDIQGRMLEDIVFLETKRTYGSKRNVFKLKFASGEFDMVIQDKAKKQCEIFEIKHSKQMVSTQYRHINNEEKIVLTEAQFGKVVRKCVLYRGESQVLENGVEYKKVEEFLKGLRN
ncbi:MAG: AAA family ATPase [Spirochaetia bacterium]|nr:AAA family ATPase [Spirochaetia bacterium]